MQIGPNGTIVAPDGSTITPPATSHEFNDVKTRNGHASHHDSSSSSSTQTHGGHLGGDTIGPVAHENAVTGRGSLHAFAHEQHVEAAATSTIAVALRAAPGIGGDAASAAGRTLMGGAARIGTGTATAGPAAAGAVATGGFMLLTTAPAGEDEATEHAHVAAFNAAYGIGTSVIPKDSHLSPTASAAISGLGAGVGAGAGADAPGITSHLEARRDARTLAATMTRAGVAARVQTINCQKPPDAKYAQSRRDFSGSIDRGFSNGVRADFVRHVATTSPDTLRAWGLSGSQIQSMARTGTTPKINGNKIEVHHDVPLECGGTNDFSNLRLVRSDVHRLFTEAQLSGTAGLQAGESRAIELLTPPDAAPIFPNTPGAATAPTLNLP